MHIIFGTNGCSDSIFLCVHNCVLDRRARLIAHACVWLVESLCVCSLSRWIKVISQIIYPRLAMRLYEEEENNEFRWHLNAHIFHLFTFFLRQI